VRQLFVLLAEAVNGPADVHNSLRIASIIFVHARRYLLMCPRFTALCECLADVNLALACCSACCVSVAAR
jgi:hypothetical protein